MKTAPFAVLPLCALLAMIWNATAQAQAASPATDQAPVPRLAAAPGSFAWTVQYQYKLADPFPKTSNPVDAQIYDRMRKAHPRLESVQVIKAENRREEVEKYTDGSETARWMVGDHLLTDNRVSHSVQIVNAAQSAVKFQEDFYDLDWINKAEFRGHQTIRGIDCYVYHAVATGDDIGKTAYVNAKSGLPLMIDTADAVLTYSFKPSNSDVVLPEDLNRRLQSVVNVKPA